MQTITGIIIAKNEAHTIEKAIASLGFCDEIIVADDGSSDLTVEHAKKSGAKIIILTSNDNFSHKRNEAMKHAQNDWVIFIDADEKISQELANEIKKAINNQNLDGDYCAFYLKRRDYFWNRELQYGETLKLRNKGLIRLMKKGSGTWKGYVHEEFVLSRPHEHRVGVLGAYLTHYPHPTVKEFISDINRYSSIRAKELYDKQLKAGAIEIVMYPMAKFILNYFLYLGFLDGPAGFVYSFLMSFHSFLVRSKLYQLNHIHHT